MTDQQKNLEVDRRKRGKDSGGSSFCLLVRLIQKRELEVS